MKTIQLISKKATFIAFSIGLFIYQQEIKAQTEDSQTSIIGKVLCGYQGWFNTQGDGSNRGWNHYKGSNGLFEPGTATIDFSTNLVLDHGSHTCSIDGERRD